MRHLVITASEFEKMCDRLARMVGKKFKPDCMVGLGRGGLVPAVYLSDRLDIRKLYAFRIYYYKGEKLGKKPVISQRPPLRFICGNVLIVDDIADTGATLLIAKKLLKKHSKNIRTATLHCKPHSRIKPDFFVQETKRWVVYPYQTTEFGKK